MQPSTLHRDPPIKKCLDQYPTINENIQELKQHESEKQNENETMGDRSCVSHTRQIQNPYTKN